MRIVGLIAEYNPFHNGHQYHIQKAKEVTGADAVVVVMSGNYVQRGTPAIMPKQLRAEAALKCGADVILELPVCYATGSAEQFAYGAVSLLDKLGCVDALCFGSECGDIDALSSIAEILVEEPPEYKTLLQDFLRVGMSFPLARQRALETIFPNKNYSLLLDNPNNILGIEYLKALKRINSRIIPYAIFRIDSDYHDEELRSGFSSATAIRKHLVDRFDQGIQSDIPAECYDLYQKNYQMRYPVFADDYSLLLKYKLLNETKESLLVYADVSEELSNRICKNLNRFESFEQFCQLLKTKEVTYSRISRALLHILLNIKKSDCEEISYARILGFKIQNPEALSAIKKSASIPLLTKISSSNCISESDIFSSNLYESVITSKFNAPFINEYEHQIVRV